MRLLSLVTSFAILAGCGDAEIDAVKNSYVDYQRTTTVEQAIDGRSLCESSEWAVYSDESGRRVVRSECVFKDSNDFYRKVREDFTEATRKHEEVVVAGLNKELSEYRVMIEDNSQKILDIDSGKALSDFESDVARDESDAGQNSGFKSNRQVILDLSSGLEMMSNTAPDDDGVLSFFVSEEFKKFVRLPVNDELSGAEDVRAVVSAFGFFESQYENLKKRSGQDYEQYKKDNLNGYLESFASAIPALHGYCKEFVQADDLKVAEERDRKIARHKEWLASSLETLKSEVANYEREVEIISSRLKSIEENPTDPVKVGLERYPVFKGMAERFYWVVNQESEVILIGSELLGLSEEEAANKVIVKYSDPAGRLSLVAGGKLNDYSAYLRSLNLM